jgi:hypothetical protein
MFVRHYPLSETVLHIKMIIFSDVAPCKLAEVYRRFRGAYCLQNRPDGRGSKHLWNIGKLIQDYATQHPRRRSSSNSLPWEPEIWTVFHTVYMTFRKWLYSRLQMIGCHHTHRCYYFYFSTPTPSLVLRPSWVRLQPSPNIHLRGGGSIFLWNDDIQREVTTI